MRFRPIGRRHGAIAALVTSSMLVSGLFAANAFAQSDTPDQATTFTWGDTSEPSSLNPMVGYLGTDWTFWAVSYNIPIEWNKDFGPDLEHSIVTSVDASSDGMTFTYHIRPDMKWSDGQPFDANDVAWTLNYYKSNHISNYLSYLALLDSITATDDTTVVMKSSQPTSLYSGDSVFLYTYILPEHIWSKFGDVKEAKQFANFPNVGSGPYVIADYKQGQSVTLERNPNYWGTSIGLTPTYDRLVYVIYNNEDAEAAALQNGEIDFAQVDSANILNSLKTKPNIETRGAIVPFFEELAFNTGSAFQTNPAGGFKPHGDGAHAVTDPVVRRAIRQVVDNQTIVDKVLLGYGASADSPVQPNATTGNWDPPPDDLLPLDVDAANASLDAAGYTKGSDGIRVDPVDNKPLVFRYYTRNNDQNSIETAPFIKDWLAEIGIKLEIASVSSAKLTTIIEDGTYEMFDWDWYPDPDPDAILADFTCAERAPAPGVYGNNDSYYCNPEYDKLYAAQRSTTSATERADIVHQMQAILWRDQPYVTMYYGAVLQAYRTDRVTGFSPQPGDTADTKGDLLAAYGPFSFISMRPAEGATGQTATKGASSTVWIVLVIIALAVLGGFMILRRRRVADEDAD